MKDSKVWEMILFGIFLIWFHIFYYKIYDLNNNLSDLWTIWRKKIQNVLYDSRTQTCDLIV